MRKEKAVSTHSLQMELFPEYFPHTFVGLHSWNADKGPALPVLIPAKHRGKQDARVKGAPWKLLSPGLTSA